MGLAWPRRERSTQNGRMIEKHLPAKTSENSTLELKRSHMYRNRLINRTERMSLAKPPVYGMSPGSFLLCPSSMFAA
jgi:hypothetical protein